MTTTEPQSADRERWLWLLAFALLAITRLTLPFRASDTMLAHAAVVDSLLNGHNWGRQALVASLEYPLLPTLALLLARVVAVPFGVAGGDLLVAFCQAWALIYVLRLTTTARQRLVVLAGLVFVGSAFDVLDAFASADPNWIVAPLLGAAVYHLSLWHRERELRDAVLAAATTGVLAFAGLPGIALGLALLCGMGHFISLTATGPKEERNGLKWLVWTPFCYCLLLLLLWNWPIMDSPFFLLGHLVAALRAKTTGNLIEAITNGLGHEIGWFPLAAMVASALCLSPGKARRATASALTIGLLAVVLARTVSGALAIYPPGSGILLTVGALGLVGLALAGADWQGHRWRAGLGVLVLLLGIVASHLVPGQRLDAEAQFTDGAPARAEIEACVDQQWPRSRVAVYGLRPAAIYHDAAERRFVARIDFHEGVFLAQGQDEILHLLLPPDNDRYYPQGVSPFSSMATTGRPWLLLERTWPSGWQLWRCVVTPERHSKLGDL